MLRVKSSAFAPSLTRIASGIRLDDVAHDVERAVIVHRRRILRQRFRHLRDVLRLALADGVEPLGRRLRPVRSHGAEHRRHARPDVADDRRIDAHVAVGFLRRDVDLDELLAAPRLRRRAAPCLALALREQPVETRADQHHDVGPGQHVRACRGRGLLVRVGQESLRHGHRQVRDAGLFDERADVGVGLRVRRALAEDDQRTLGALQQIERALARRRAPGSGAAPDRRP